MSVHTANYRVEWRPSTAWIDITSQILDGDPNIEFSGNRDNALSFGDASETRYSFETQDLSLQDTNWYLVPIRVFYTMDGVERPAFAGVITSRTRGQETLSFEAEGFAYLIRRTRMYTVARYRRPVATATSVASVENPDDVAYQGGLINEALWRAGGRPAEQDFAYPNATFYYSVPETAILAPEWSWLAGENAWDECLRMARAAGGQLFQAPDGIVRYIQPLAYGNSLPSIVLTEDDYADLRESTTAELAISGVQCPFTPRTLQAFQQVISDTTPRLVAAGTNIVITLEAQHPLRRLQLDGSSLPEDAIRATFLSGRVATRAHYTHSVGVAGQRITINLTNTTSEPFAINAITLIGEPIVAGESEVVTVGSTTNALTIEDNPYVQSRAHAERLATMVMAFHGTARPIRTATGCVYNPQITVGDTIGLTCSRWNLYNSRHLVVAVRPSGTGMESEYDLVPVDGLPRTDEFFIIGTTNYSGLSRKLGF